MISRRQYKGHRIECAKHRDVMRYATSYSPDGPFAVCERLADARQCIDRWLARERQGTLPR